MHIDILKPHKLMIVLVYCILFNCMTFVLSLALCRGIFPTSMADIAYLCWKCR